MDERRHGKRAGRACAVHAQAGHTLNYVTLYSVLLASQATAQLSGNVITLKGSAEIVTEFFAYSINRSAILWFVDQDMRAMTEKDAVPQHSVPARNLSPREFQASAEVRAQHAGHSGRKAQRLL